MIYICMYVHTYVFTPLTQGVSSMNAYYDAARVVDTLYAKKSQLLRQPFLIK